MSFELPSLLLLLDGTWALFLLPSSSVLSTPNLCNRSRADSSLLPGSSLILTISTSSSSRCCWDMDCSSRMGVGRYSGGGELMMGRWWAAEGGWMKLVGRAATRVWPPLELLPVVE